MTLGDSIQTFRLRVLQEGIRGQVSATCRRFGVSRTVFYRWRQRFKQYGPDGLHPKRPGARRGASRPAECGGRAADCGRGVGVADARAPVGV